MVDLSEDGLALNIRADTTGSAQSVSFAWDGATIQTENAAPFALAGDNSGVYLKWRPAPGTRTLRTVPYPKTKRGGVAGAAREITITVVN